MTQPPATRKAQAMNALAIAAAASLVILPGCFPNRGDYTDWEYRDKPVERAYHDYWDDGARRAESALQKAKFGVTAPRNAASVAFEIASLYSSASHAALLFATNESPFPADAAKLRATADARMRAATAAFKAHREKLRNWCDNYYEVEAAVVHADTLAERAMSLRTSR